MDSFHIAIDPPQNSIYSVRITTAAGEQAIGTLTLPQADANWEALLAKLAYRDRTTIFSEDEVIQLGQRLYDLLIQGKTAELFQSATSQAAIAKRPLQIQIQVASHPDLVPVAALPWEFLTDPQGHPLVTHHSLVRSLPHSSPIPPLTVDGPLTMLLAWALPTELANDYPLNIDAEVQAIQLQIQPLIDSKQFMLHILPHATPLNLNRTIQDYQPHLLHILGHGQAATSGTPQLVLETEDGETQLVSPRTLSMALQGSQVRLIVLNACHSGAQGAAFFQSFGPALLTSGIPAVIGMQASVLDRAGRVFATELYRTLVKTGSVDQAVQQGRKALILTDVSQVDWGLATLFLRAQDGQLLGKPSADGPPPAGGDTVFNQHGQQVGTQYNAGQTMTIHVHGADVGRFASVPAVHLPPKPIAERFKPGVDPNALLTRTNILFVSQMIDQSRAALEGYLGPPNEVTIRGIGSADELPDGGETRWYPYGAYLVSVNYTKTEIARGVRIEGLARRYGLNDWFDMLQRVGMPVRQPPDADHAFMLTWANYQGYFVSVALDKVDGVINVIRVYKRPA